MSRTVAEKINTPTYIFLDRNNPLPRLAVSRTANKNEVHGLCRGEVAYCHGSRHILTFSAAAGASPRFVRGRKGVGRGSEGTGRGVDAEGFSEASAAEDGVGFAAGARNPGGETLIRNEGARLEA